MKPDRTQLVKRLAGFSTLPAARVADIVRRKIPGSLDGSEYVSHVGLASYWRQSTPYPDLANSSLTMLFRQKISPGVTALGNAGIIAREPAAFIVTDPELLRRVADNLTHMQDDHGEPLPVSKWANRIWLPKYLRLHQIRDRWIPVLNGVPATRERKGT